VILRPGALRLQPPRPAASRRSWTQQGIDKPSRVLLSAPAPAGQIVAVAGEPARGKARLLWSSPISPGVNGWWCSRPGPVARQDDLYLPVSEMSEGFQTERTTAADREKVPEAHPLDASCGAPCRPSFRSWTSL